MPFSPSFLTDDNFYPHKLITAYKKTHLTSSLLSMMHTAVTKKAWTCIDEMIEINKKKE